MKGTLEFTLPEERDDLDTAVYSMGLVRVIQEMDQWLRDKLKYETPNQIEAKTLQAVRDYLWEEIKDRDLERIINL